MTPPRPATRRDPGRPTHRAAARSTPPAALPGWLDAALGYLPRWLEHQLRITEQPGLQLAVAWRGRTVLQQAFGHADLSTRTRLTTRHRFRVASHSKTFTATAVMKLREQGRIGLDDPIGRHVGGLRPAVGSITVAQLLSHAGGLLRDGVDAGQWAERRPFLHEAELRADLALGQPLDPGQRFKYSNHGYGLLGLAIETVTGERYADWMAREVIAAAGLRHTDADATDGGPAPARLAAGHSARWPLGRRVTIPAAMSTHVLAPATGFVATAADLAHFFGQLSPEAGHSLLSVSSRRLMTHRLWAEPHASTARWYGLGTMSGNLGGWDWFGHTGGFPGTLSRTCVVPSQDLAISMLTNAADGPSQGWVDGALRVLQAYARHGAPSARSAAWTGRWWSLWNVVDLLPMGDRVLLANPGLANPVLDAAEVGELRGLRGRIVAANGYAHHGEPAALERDARGRLRGLKLGGMRLTTEAEAAAELRRRYGDPPAA